MSKWKDTSCFAQGDRDRVPDCFEAKLGKFKLVVHRHILYPKDQWLASCHPDIFRLRQLKSKGILEAQLEAMALLQVELEGAIRAIAESGAKVGK